MNIFSIPLPNLAMRFLFSDTPNVHHHNAVLRRLIQALVLAGSAPLISAIFSSPSVKRMSLFRRVPLDPVGPILQGDPKTG